MPSKEYRSVPVYRGQVQACVFDWAGTVVDSGVFAPVEAFRSLFEAEGVDVTNDELRAPMGVHKRVHIAEMLSMPRVRTRWIETHNGAAPTDEDIERLYQQSLGATIQVLPKVSHVIEGVKETMDTLRGKYGIKIGATTGYTSQVLNELKPIAKAEGFSPDFCVTSDLVTEGRPSPAMIYLNMVNLNVWNACSVIKVDDTGTGITAGIHAGCWTVGVAKTGNFVGLNETELKKPSNAALIRERMQVARNKLFAAGAHFVIDTVNDLPGVVDEINRRLAMGLRPS